MCIHEYICLLDMYRYVLGTYLICGSTLGHGWTAAVVKISLHLMAYIRYVNHVHVEETYMCKTK